MKFCTTLVFCCINLLCTAQKSAFYVFTKDIKITICLNDKQCTETPSTSIFISNIPNEIVGVEVKSETGDVLFRDILFLNLDTNYYFSLLAQGNKLIAQRVKPAPLDNPLQIIYEGTLNKKLQHESALAQTSVLTGETDLETFEATSAKQQQPSTKPTTILYGSIKTKQDNKSSGKTCSIVANSPFIRATRNELKKVVGFNAQLSFLKTQLNNYCFYTDQLKDLLKTIEEDNAKLDLISSLKHNILDPNKLLDLSSLFLFDTSIEELERIKSTLEND